MTTTLKVLQVIGAVAATGALVGGLTKILVSHFLAKEKEKYKNELSRLAFSFQTQFSRLHEKRAEAIEEVHGLIHETANTLRELGKMGAEDDAEKLFDTFQTSAKKLIACVSHKRIYFTVETEQTVNKATLALIHLSHLVYSESFAIRIGDRYLALTKRLEDAQAKADSARDATEAEFRRLLGVG